MATPPPLLPARKSVRRAFLAFDEAAKKRKEQAQDVESNVREAFDAHAKLRIAASADTRKVFVGTDDAEGCVAEVRKTFEESLAHSAASACDAVGRMIACEARRTFGACVLEVEACVASLSPDSRASQPLFETATAHRTLELLQSMDAALDDDLKRHQDVAGAAKLLALDDDVDDEKEVLIAILRCGGSVPRELQQNIADYRLCEIKAAR